MIEPIPYVPGFSHPPSPESENEIVAQQIEAGVTLNSVDLANGINYGGIKVWEGFLSQAGAGDPTATVMEGVGNSLGTITFARTGAGIYTATISPAGAFTAGKTFVYFGGSLGYGPDGNATDTVTTVHHVVTSDSVITIYTGFASVVNSASGLSDEILNNTEMLIKVYP